MIKEKLPYIRIFKMITGDEIIAKVVEETTDEFLVEKALHLVQGQQGIQFAPYLILADPDKQFSINKNLVPANAPPVDKLVTQYLSLTSGIQIQQKGSIIV